MSMFPPAIKWLLAINIALFLLMLAGGEMINVLLIKNGALWPIGSPYFRPWQYISYMFLHGGFTHIFFNMLALWMFGIELEQMWGSRRFLGYYLLCGLGAGIVHSIVMLMMGTENVPTVGASGAIYGITLAFGLAFPDRIIFMGFFLPMRARIAVLVFIGFELYAGVTGTSDGIAHFAHLGGALVGFILIKVGGVLTLGGVFDRFPWFNQTPRDSMPAFEPPVRRQPNPQIIDAQFRDVGGRAPSERDRPYPRMDFGADQSRIDEILDKISRSGYQNLTDEEKAILNEASKKMR